MAAGTYTNSIAALNGIFGALSEVIKILNTSEKDSKTDKTKEQVKSLNKGGLSSEVSAQGANEQINIAQPASLKEVTSALSGLPASVKAIAILHGKTIQNFRSVLTDLSEVLSDFADGGKVAEGSKALADTAQGLAKLQELKFFSLLLSFSLADKLNLGKKIGKVVSQISDAMSTADKMKLDKESVEKFKNLNSSLIILTDSVKRVSLVSPLIPIFDLAMLLLKPGLSIYVSILKKLENAKISKSSTEAIKLLNDLTKGLTGVILSTIVLAAAFKFIGVKETLLGLAASLAIMTALTGLSLVVMAVANKMKSSENQFQEINKFIRNIVLSTGAIVALSLIVAAMKTQVWSGLAVVGSILLGLTALGIVVGLAGNLMRRSHRGLVEISVFLIAVTLMTGAVLGLAMLATAHKETIIPGLGIVAGVILGLTLISILAAAASAVISPRSFKDVMLVAGFSLALVLGTLLIGAIMSIPGTWELLAYGLGAVVAMLGAMTLIAFTAGILGALVMGAGAELKQVIFFSGFVLAFVLGTILIGEVVKLGWDAALIGLAAIGVALGALTGIVYTMSALSKKIKEAEARGVIKDILIFTGSIVLITLGIVAIGALIKNVGIGWTTAGLVAFSAVLWEMVGVAATIISIDKSNVLRDSQKGLIEISIFAGAIMATTAGIVGIAKLMQSVPVQYIIGSFVLFSGVLVAALQVAKFASEKKRVFRQGAKDIRDALLIIGASEVVLGGIIGLSYLLKDLIQDDWKNLGYVGLVFIAMNGIIAGAAKLSQLAQKHSADIKKGAISLLLAEGVILSSSIVLGAILLLAKQLKDSHTGGEDGAIAMTLVAMTGVILGAVGLAKLASKFEKDMIKGSVGLLLAEVIAFGAAKVLAATIEVAKEAKALEGWGTIFATLGAMATIVAGFGAIAIAAGLLTVGPQSVWFFAGIAALGLAEILAFGAAKVLSATIEVTKEADTLGPGGFGKIFATIGAMATLVAGFGALGTALGLAAPFIALGVLSFKGVTTMANASKEILETTIEYIKKADEYKLDKKVLKEHLNTILSVSNQYRDLALKMPIFGLAVGVTSITRIREFSSILIDVIKTYNELESIEIKDAKVFNRVEDIINSYKTLADEAADKYARIKKGLRQLSRITESMYSTFEIVDVYIKLAEKLNKINVSPEQLSRDMKSIMSAMDPSVLLDLFRDSDGNDLSDTSDVMKKIKKGAKAYDKMIDLVGNTMSMFANFLKNTKGINLNNVDFSGIATSISGAVGAFMTTLDGGIEELSRSRAKELKRVSEVLESLISPISNFAQVLVAYSGSGDTLKQIWYDENGLPIEGKPVNVIETAQVLVKAVTNFCSVLYNEENMRIWKNLAEGKTDKSQSDLEKGIGVFASIVDPVVKFAEVLSKFEAEGNDTLVIPEYDKDGNLKPNSRKINVKTVATVIAGAVTQFIQSLYVDNKQTWLDLIDTLNTTGVSEESTELTGTKAPLSDAIGVFADILNPIMNFAGVLEKFGIAKSGNLAIVDKNGKLKEINVTEVSTKISDAITAFISKVGGIFSNPETLESISSIGENSGAIIVAINNFGNSFSNIAGLDFKNLDGNTEALSRGMTSISNTIVATTQMLSNETLDKFDRIFKSQTEIAEMNTSLTGFASTILSLTNETTVEGAEQFNEKFNTLINHIESASQDSNVKKLDKFSKSIKTSTTELKSFDKTLDSGRTKRNKDLKDFSEALKPIINSLRDAKDDIKNLRDLFDALNRTDSSKIAQLVGAAGEINDTIEKRKTKNTGGVSINYDSIGKAFFNALVGVLDGATLKGTDKPQNDSYPNKDRNIFFSLDVGNDYKSSPSGWGQSNPNGEKNGK